MQIVTKIEFNGYTNIRQRKISIQILLQRTKKNITY